MDLQQIQVYKPAIGEHAERQPRAAADGAAELRSVDQCESIRHLDDSQLLVGASEAVARKEVHMADVAVVKEGKSSVVGRKRRGRPPGGQGRPKTTPLRKKNDEEDVCFICFDGGSLVLCDRRGCPKAYHPSCIKRDEAFFKSKAKWNCGWHICSSCQKASHYMCYTCTYSLCKGCIKDADYQCVRGNKGFCGTCMRTIMLIENVQGNKEAAQVDFDDKSSWEYLFKVYWILLKGQLSLTLDELIKAKNPWKGAAAVVACKGGASGEVHIGHKTNDSGSLNSCLDLEAANSCGSHKKPRIGDGGTSLAEGTNWASKELLEFVAHMKNGDVSVLSQFDVQALLLEYIKKNNLRDPHRKCQIICDLRLRNLFGKECVGHFEMLKLLEYHYLIKESSASVKSIGAGVVNGVATEMEIDGNYDNQMMMCSDKKRKTRKRTDERVPPTNPDAYAAIDVHNINLIYLRRNLLENLLDDVDKFHERVVGSIVRIRISSSDQKHDTYRLVQVIGTNKVAEGYKIGTRTTDMKLEISNLDKKEVLPIDQISDQEFSQDECKRLHQSIICGLIKRFTVGEIQDKAMALRAFRVNDELAAEVLRLRHLRDRASEKGRRKELRELVEKLQLLDSPEERHRRLREIPEIHIDPKMDPSYVSEDNTGELDKKQDGKVKTRRSVFGRKGRESFSPRREGGISNNSGSKAQNNQVREALGINGLNTTANQANHSGLVRCGRNNESAVESNISSEVASENSSMSFSAVMKANLPVESFEMEKIWHYQDPAGKVQGPFAMVQLCKWGTTGFFPPDHRIWRINENQDDSILFTDALKGQYCKKPLLPQDSNIQSEGLKVALDGRNNVLDGGWNKSMNATPIDGRKVEESWNTKQHGQSLQNGGNTEVVRSNTPADAVNSNEKQTGIHNSGNTEVVRSSTPADAVNSNEKQTGIHNNGNTEVLRSSTPADAVNSNEKQTGIHLQGCESVKVDISLTNQPQECSSLTSPVLSVKPYETLSHQEGEGTTENDSHQKNGTVDWQQTTRDQMNNEQGNENRSDSEGQSVQSSAQNWTHPPASSPSNGCDFTSDFVPVAKTFETSEQDEKGRDFPSLAPKPSNGDLRGQASENNQSLSSNLPVQDGGHSWSGSNLVGGGEQLHKVTGDWGGYSPTPAKPSVEEWDSSLVSASSLKPSEMPSDYVAAPVSVSGQLTEPIPSHPTSIASSWQEILTETNEFCTLAADESVSDLLAEVEAMESLCGLATPTSTMNCGGEFTEGSKNDSISSEEGFSPAPEPGKGDALSSTCDLQLSEAMVTDEPLGARQASILDLQQRSGVHSSTSPELHGDRKPSDVSVNELEANASVDRLEANVSVDQLEANVSVDQMEAGEIPTTAPSKECWDMSSTDNPWKARLESRKTSLEAVQGNINANWGGSDPGGTNVLDLQQNSGVHSSTSTEVRRKPSNVSVNQLEANVSVNQLEPGEIQITAPSKESWDMSTADNPWKPRLESRETSCEAVQGNVNAGWGGDRGSTNMGWRGPDPGSANVGWRGGQGTIQGNTGASAGGMWEGQSRYGGDKSSGPRGRGFPSRDNIGFGKGRFVGNRQALYGNGNGGGSFRPPPRGQRVCKYHESGYCKKGASCSYLHP
ncbi:zinc finger CCCH domain-containing protein 44 isoform X2 [Rosa chinensis]|uniref:zinc finger CCCH domain-containing protein 44 isoform X2 n=1 Tax=Rosa chinensis TaxID=74649 RepID=UPI000D0897D8|nr:zinc finger CCCH domain-containing protein 44 isoform X2 [Rosa chinensis]